MPTVIYACFVLHNFCEKHGMTVDDNVARQIAHDRSVQPETSLLTCRKCGGKDHVAGGCSNSRCFHCEGPGHRAHQCPEPPLCGVFLAPRHRAINCPFIIFSGNVGEMGTFVSYARAVSDKSRPAPRNTRPATRPAAAPKKTKNTVLRKMEQSCYSLPAALSFVVAEH